MKAIIKIIEDINKIETSPFLKLKQNQLSEMILFEKINKIIKSLARFIKNKR